MKLETLQVPESVLASTRYVTSVAEDVVIEPEKLDVVALQVSARLAQGIDAVETAFGTTGSLEQDVNLVFFETAANFCFWAESETQKWKIEKNGQQVGGWYGLAASFDRAAKSGLPVYDAKFMAELTLETAGQIFAGNGNEIPLLKQRVDNLREAGAYLQDEYDGQAVRLLEQVEFSAPQLAEKVVKDLSSYRDGARYDGKWIWLLKRAQILPSDLSQLTVRYSDFHIQDTDKLTAFADYRLPQVLRHLGALAYSPSLATAVDTGRPLAAGSRAEVEIRAATIVAVEALKTILLDRTSADIDLGLWLLSQDMNTDPTLKPHHRTLGYFY